MAPEFTDILRDALAVEVPDQVRRRCRQKVMAGAERILARKQAAPLRPGSRRSLMLKPVALTAALFTLLFAGTAWAATGANPDDLLYPVKQRLEAARTSIALQNIDQARVQVAHAQTRLDEIENMVNRDRPDYVPGLLADYDRLMASAAEHLQTAAAEGEDTTAVEILASAAGARHDELLRSLSGTDESGDQPGEKMDIGTTGTMETPGAGTQSSGGMGNGAATESHTPGGSDAGNAGSGTMSPQAPSMEQGSPGDTGSGGSDSRQQNMTPPANISSPTGMSSQSLLEQNQNERSATPMPGR